MIKGFYAAASAMIAGMHRQDVLSQNIANLDTPGFRQILLAMDDWYVTPIKLRSQELSPNLNGKNHISYPGYLGLGTETSEAISDFTQGAIKATNNELDFAIQGNGFFRLETPDGIRYTRDGRFLRDAEGTLVTVDGYQVLDTNGRPITLPDSQVTVDEQGNVTDSDGKQVAQIDLVAFEDPQTELTRAGMNIFSAEGEPTGEDPGSIHQGSLEMANANIQQLMTQMVIVARAYEANQRIVQLQDESLGKLFNSLGR